MAWETVKSDAEWALSLGLRRVKIKATTQLFFNVGIFVEIV